MHKVSGFTEGTIKGQKTQTTKNTKKKKPNPMKKQPQQ